VHAPPLRRSPTQTPGGGLVIHCCKSIAAFCISRRHRCCGSRPSSGCYRSHIVFRLCRSAAIAFRSPLPQPFLHPSGRCHGCPHLLVEFTTSVLVVAVMTACPLSGCCCGPSTSSFRPPSCRSSLLSLILESSIVSVTFAVAELNFGSSLECCLCVWFLPPRSTTVRPCLSSAASCCSSSLALFRPATCWW
jgi:hypothetical protein